MRVSQGVPSGRGVYIYHPELLDDHEEVIIYTRNEFRRTYTLMQEQVDFIHKLDFRRYNYEREDHVGHWPMIMDRVHILASGMNSLLGDKPLQAYLDSYLYNEVEVREESLESVGKVSAGSLGVGRL
jgi:hypothetical protein